MAIYKARRKLLQLTGLASAGLAAYSYRRGIRFPSLAWEPRLAPNRWSIGQADLVLKNVIASSVELDSITLRAYTPQPEMQINSGSGETINLVVHNIFPDAYLELSEQYEVGERIEGITRYLTINAPPNSSLNIKWQIAERDTYTFAAIGDTGGGKELEWCIKRAGDLGARFLLHLGDFNYQEGDYSSTIALLNAAPLPCFVSIGNHDFHESGLVYDRFLKEIGPLNNAFSIGKTRFVNIDTAANTLPYSGGLRGSLMRSLIVDKESFTETVAFTHRPLHNPVDDGSHDIGSEGERDWLVKALKQAGITTLLSGHLHIFDRRTVFGIDNIIVGQGLGHQDLLTNKDYSQIALGQVSKNGNVEYQFPTLAMPMELHCHPRTERVKKELRNGPHAELLKQVDAACDT